MMRWCPVQEEKIRIVAQRYNVTVESAKEIIDIHLRTNMRHIRNYEPVVLVNMGLFYMDPRKTNARILRVLKKYRAGNMTAEEVRTFLSVWWPLHNKARSHRPMVGKRYTYHMRKYGSDWGVLKKVKHVKTDKKGA